MTAAPVAVSLGGAADASGALGSTPESRAEAALMMAEGGCLSSLFGGQHRVLLLRETQLAKAEFVEDLALGEHDHVIAFLRRRGSVGNDHYLAANDPADDPGLRERDLHERASRVLPTFGRAAIQDFRGAVVNLRDRPLGRAADVLGDPAGDQSTRADRVVDTEARHQSCVIGTVDHGDGLVGTEAHVANQLE